MVVARNKIVIQDKIYHPPDELIFNFYCANPENLYHFIRKQIEKSFIVKGHDIQEKAFSFQKIGDLDKFKVKWEAIKDIDKFSYFRITIGLSGSSTKGFGTANVDIKVALRTEYPQDKLWQKTMIYEFSRVFWHNIFYENTRQEYTERGRVLVNDFVNKLIQYFEGIKKHE